MSGDIERKKEKEREREKEKVTIIKPITFQNIAHLFEEKKPTLATFFLGWGWGGSV